VTAHRPANAFSRLAPSGPRQCKICGDLALVHGQVDFSKSCAEVTGTVLPHSGLSIAYNRCPRCEFLFSASFDDWTRQDFIENIYNEDYGRVDPDYEAARPAANAGFLCRLFDKRKSTLSLLDYGGGNGALARALLAAGFAEAATFDPLVAKYSAVPGRKFAVVASFETLEHTPDPLAAIRQMAELLQEPGIIVFSTLVQPRDFATQGLAWWYVGPRNGHISIFSRKSLAAAWRSVGFTLGSFNDNAHVAFREIPDFARHLFGAP
jgi:SAM-dependent methyltransferase